MRYAAMINKAKIENIICLIQFWEKYLIYEVLLLDKMLTSNVEI